ncbi:type II secretion system ATPase GspE [Hydrogenispora ethanolica]|nr:type II secretion system ATPase GspE [Hydrogenispora ethanolica]
MSRQKLGDLLVRHGFITPQQLADSLEEQRKTEARLGSILVKRGYLTEQNLIEVLEFQLGIPHVVIAKKQIAPETVELVPEQLARKYKVFPVDRAGERIILGMLDPTDVFAIDELRLSLNMEIQPVIVTEEDLNRAINQYYGMRGSIEEVFKDLDIEFEQTKEEPQYDDLEAAEEAPIVKLVNLIMTQAVKERASDIHLEPTEKELLVRFRIDGHLKKIMTSPKNTQAAIISRIKIISGMNIAEKRLPQDGRVQIRVEGTAIDMRVSAIPTLFGEKIVMRLLFKTNIMARMEQLGFIPMTLEKFRTVYRQPHGIILVTGPTGSGKSTTLSAVLNELNSPDINILTVEDPVEYQIPGVNQVQVNNKAGLTFAAALRSFLRQDPDIIMVGEIRDRETAQIASQAALTGHLVLSTLHTNDAPSTVTRLIDMGIEPFLVASTLAGVLAQRLVRSLCKQCKEPYRLQPDDPYYKIVTTVFPNFDPDKHLFYRGRGCPECHNTGYARRMAIHEVLIINQELRATIAQNVPAAALKDVAVGNGMLTLFQDGLVKAMEGLTSLDEIVRAAYTFE